MFTRLPNLASLALAALPALALSIASVREAPRTDTAAPPAAASIEASR